MIDVRVETLDVGNPDPVQCKACDINAQAMAVLSISTTRERVNGKRRTTTKDTVNHFLCVDCVLRMAALFEVAVDSFMESHGRRKRA